MLLPVVAHTSCCQRCPIQSAGGGTPYKLLVVAPPASCCRRPVQAAARGTPYKAYLASYDPAGNVFSSRSLIRMGRGGNSVQVD